jgi:hypothetical protein
MYWLLGASIPSKTATIIAFRGRSRCTPTLQNPQSISNAARFKNSDSLNVLQALHGEAPQGCYSIPTIPPRPQLHLVCKI